MISSGLDDAMNIARTFNGANLNGVTLCEARLMGVDFKGVNLSYSSLWRANLSSSDLSYTNLDSINFQDANLSTVNLTQAKLNDSVLTETNLSGANLSGANLLRANLWRTDLSNVVLRGTKLHKANLSGVTFDSKTRFTGILFEDIDLTAVDWSQLFRFGDDPFWLWQQGSREDLRELARTYRQLAILLRSQGMNDEADRFSYDAQVAQRGYLARSLLNVDSTKTNNVLQYFSAFKYLSVIKYFNVITNVFRYLFSHSLNLIAGYGYKPGRSFFWYVVMIGGFMIIYMNLGSHLSWGESLVLSLSSFHGRGFFDRTNFHLSDPIAYAAAVEAVIGLFIEISFIATFTQRIFGK